MHKLKKQSSSIIPCRLNSDNIENIFCHQGTIHNGANTNPICLGYSMNSVILGQATISRKSKTGGEAAQIAGDHHQFPQKVYFFLKLTVIRKMSICFLSAFIYKIVTRIS